MHLTSLHDSLGMSPCPKAAPGFKLKTLLKEFANTATSTAGTVHRSRRSYVIGELTAMMQLLSISPGL